MVTDCILRGTKIILRQIEMSDCTETYVKWLNDTEVNRYLETKWLKQTLGTIKEFVAAQRENSHSILFAITDNITRRHIGNIKIGPINKHYGYADISYFIGEKTFWHKGIATEAIGLGCKFGFEKMLLHRIEAGVYENAVGSWKALEKNGFLREGVFRNMVYFEGKYIDVFSYGILEEEFYKKIGSRDSVRQRCKEVED